MSTTAKKQPRYTPIKVYILPSQEEKLRKVISQKRGSSIYFKKLFPEHNNDAADKSNEHVLLFTPSQIQQIEKVTSSKETIRIYFTPAQIQANIHKHSGGFLGLIAMTVASIVASTASAAIAHEINKGSGLAVGEEEAPPAKEGYKAPPSQVEESVPSNNNDDKTTTKLLEEEIPNNSNNTTTKTTAKKVAKKAAKKKTTKKITGKNNPGAEEEEEEEGEHLIFRSKNGRHLKVVHKGEGLWLRQYRHRIPRSHRTFMTKHGEGLYRKRSRDSPHIEKIATHLNI